MAKLTAKQWLDIRTRYEMGDSNNSIAKDYNIPESTIRAKAKSQNWVRKLRAQITNIQKNFQEIANVCEPSQIPIIKQRCSDIFDFIDKANYFVKKAAKMNLDVLDELESADTKTKIIGLGTLKATMPELAKLVGLQNEISEKENQKQPIKDITIPDDPVAAARAYDQLMAVGKDGR